VTDPPGARDRAAFEAFAREECRRRLERTALVCIGVFAGAWLLGRILLAGQPAEGPGRVWLAVMTGIAVVTWACCRYVPAARRRPIALAVLAYAAIGWAAGSHVSAMGDLDSPFFYAVYTMPPLPIGLPTRQRPRILLSLAGTGAFVGTYFGVHPEYLAHPMIHVPIVCLVAVLIISLAIGHQVYELVRDRFFFGLRLERQQAQLEAHARHLEREVDDQTHVLAELGRALREASTDRAEVARALHDDLGQLVVGVRMELEQIERSLTHAEATDAPRLDYLSDVVESLEGSVRAFIERLRTPPTSPSLESRVEELVAPLRARLSLDPQL